MVIDFKVGLNIVNEKIENFLKFVAGKLKNFGKLNFWEQVAYCCVGAGFLMILVSLVLFIL